MDWPLDLIYEVYRRCRFAEQLVLSRYLSYIDKRFIIRRIPRRHERNLSDNILIQFTGLTHLNIKNNSRVNDYTVSKLTDLQSLDISGHSTISNSGIQNLTNLRKLNYSQNYHVTADIFLKLPKLEQVSVNTVDLAQIRDFKGEVWCCGDPDGIQVTEARFLYHRIYIIKSLDEWKLINNVDDIFISKSDGLCYIRYSGRVWAPCSDLKMLIKDTYGPFYDWHEGELTNFLEKSNWDYPLYSTFYNSSSIISQIKSLDLPIRQLNYHEYLIFCNGIDYFLDTKNFCIISVERLINNYLIQSQSVGLVKTIPDEIDSQVVDDILSILVGEQCKQEYRRLLRHLFVEPEPYSYSYQLPVLLTTWCKVLCRILTKNPGICDAYDYDNQDLNGSAIILPKDVEFKTKQPGVHYIYNTSCRGGCGNYYLCVFSCECLCGINVVGFNEWISKKSHLFSEHEHFHDIHILGKLFNYPDIGNGHMMINLIKWFSG